MIAPGLLLIAVIANAGAGVQSVSAQQSEAQAAMQQEFKRAWLQATADLRDEQATAYVARQAPATRALTHRVLSRYGKPISNSDSEVVLQLNHDGRVERVLVDQNSHLRALLEEECKSLQLQPPPKLPFYLGFAIGAPAVQ